MNTGRRFLFLGVAAALAGTKSLFAVPQRRAPAPGIQRDSDPTDPNYVPAPPAANPRAQLKENQKNLRRDVDQLLQFAKDLKDEADKTEQTDVLSITLVKKAEEVEKLAKKIRDLARAF